jgi:hypothetical protein
VALASRWWEVCELELGAGRGACDGAIGSANTDAGGRGVVVVDRGVLGEVDAGGSGVCNAVLLTGRLDRLEMGGLQDNDTAKASL